MMPTVTSAAVTWRVDGHIATVWLSRPPMNLLSPEVRAGLLAAYEALGAERELRAVILTGAGERAFSAGADLNEEARLTPESAAEFKRLQVRLGTVMAELPQPTIAAINGFCMGGGFQLALGCDLRIAAETARFAAAGVKMGLVTSAVRLTRLLGEARAKEIILTGRTFDAAEALRLGVVSRVVPPGALIEEAQATAAMIASRAPLAVQAAKQAVGRIRDLTHAQALAEEHDHFCRLLGTRDHKTAVEAFFKRAQPVFRGE